ncbi:hypothetical protein EAG_07317 [Camponotus floridanus]|uniref:Uncharacterized protein n=1 Tax=Camponotus floridanus TaxID=104421 RepID=E2AFC6_CAMFO|nr:uncharacterized protein LOC105251777 [Camponotus floridanus]EFN67819.1 hypothetical protein EAG_07317 [Camponotus floridanus]
MKMLNPSRSYYSASLIIVVMLMITVYYPVLIDTAVVRSEKLDHQLIKQFGPKNVRISRAIENNDKEDAPKRYCYNTACGWAVYERDLRSIEYYMRNTCDCPDTYKCVRVGDDLSASAYVYRCRENITVDDILFSEDAN